MPNLMLLNANNVKSELRYAIGAGNTTIDITVGDGTNFPSSYPYYLLLSPDDETRREIVIVSARSSDTFTVTRAGLSTTAYAHPASERVELVTPTYVQGYPFQSGGKIEHHTADDTLTQAESGSVHTNLGEDGAMTLTLPQDAEAGCNFHFAVMTAQELRIDPGAAGAIYIAGAKQTDNKYITANDEGESIMLVADGNGDWISLYETGTWGVEGA